MHLAPLVFLGVYQMVCMNFIVVYHSNHKWIIFFSILITKHALLAIKRARIHILAKYILSLKCFVLEIKGKGVMN